MMNDKQPIQLTLQQELKLEALKHEVANASEEQIKATLIGLYQQMMIRESACKALSGNSPLWGEWNFELTGGNNG